MSTADRPANPSSPVFSSFGSAVGLALGELLIAIGQPSDLAATLREIEVAARAALLAADLQSGGSRNKRSSEP